MIYVDSNQIKYFNINVIFWNLDLEVSQVNRSLPNAWLAGFGSQMWL